MLKNTHIRIGSGNKNHVILNHSHIADEHLELFADHEGNVFITDLGSIQGTTVNGEPLRGFRQLMDTDQVVLGGKVKFNWKKYRMNDVQPPKNKPIVQNEEINTDPVKKPKINKPNAPLDVESKQLYWIYGGVALLIIIIYLIN